VQIPLSALEKSLELVPTNNPIYLFCQSGKRSKAAYRILQGKGYAKLFCLTENAIEINEITFEIIE
jgi:rhodanese-related sulfurtransferase